MPGVIVTATLCADAAADVDQVVTDAGSRNRTQPWGERKQVRRHPLPAGDQSVDFPQKRKKLLARQRKVTFWVNDFEAGGL